MNPETLVQWQPHLALAITGHRDDNPAFAPNQDKVAKALSGLFDQIDTIRQAQSDDVRDVRLHCLLAGGVDQTAAKLALERSWSLIAPLPFGSDLNLAINASVTKAEDAQALLEGREARDREVERRAAGIRSLMESASVFEIADRDVEIGRLFERMLSDPDDTKAAHRFAGLSSDNVALAGQVMIERCDLLVAVWDGKMTDLPGGTGHTVLKALQQGTPVLVIDPVSPEFWSILSRPEELGHRSHENPTRDDVRLKEIVAAALGEGDTAMQALAGEKWRRKSPFGFGIYRSIESLFGGRSIRSGTTKAVYESPRDIASGSAQSTLAASARILKDHQALQTKMQEGLVPMFAWADGVSARLSDAYRSGMSVNFILSALAIIAGIAYLPFDLAKYKWVFATTELVLLVLILAVTYAGHRRKWHRRWFETRRVAEYLRFSTGILMLGVGRPSARWPRGETREWPERFCRDALRDAGLPTVKIDRSYLRDVLGSVVLPHVQAQRGYHEAKATQLQCVHHRIDKAAEWSFLAAVVSVSLYLGLEIGAAEGLLPKDWPYASAKVFTFLGVAFPTIGANLAGIRYFGDFERFSAISRVTATKLANVEERISLLLGGSEDRLTYHVVSDLVRTVDDIVVEEIERWQAVYGAKHLSLPA